MLRGLQCPGTLVECGFLTSNTESRKIGTAVYRQQIAQAIVAGIRDYAAVVAPGQRVATAPRKAKRPAPTSKLQ